MALKEPFVQRIFSFQSSVDMSCLSGFHGEIVGFLFVCLCVFFGQPTKPLADLELENWEIVYWKNDVDSAYNTFLRIFTSLYDKNCPNMQ